MSQTPTQLNKKNVVELIRAFFPRYDDIAESLAGDFINDDFPANGITTLAGARAYLLGLKNGLGK